MRAESRIWRRNGRRGGEQKRRRKSCRLLVVVLLLLAIVVMTFTLSPFPIPPFFPIFLLGIAGAGEAGDKDSVHVAAGIEVTLAPMAVVVSHQGIGGAAAAVNGRCR